jgi:hypothetical protein
MKGRTIPPEQEAEWEKTRWFEEPKLSSLEGEVRIGDFGFRILGMDL